MNMSKTEYDAQHTNECGDGKICGEVSNCPPDAFNEQDRVYEGFYPLDFNGYVTVARPAKHIPAREIKKGDLLLLDSYISEVTSVRSIINPSIGEIYHIRGALNIIRFPHELVTVLR